MAPSKLKWLIVVPFLLELALCRTQPLAPGASPASGVRGDEVTPTPDSLTLPSGPESTLARAKKSAKRIVSLLRAKIQEKIPALHVDGNVSCGELLSASGLDDSLSSMFPQELLGLSLVPVLVVAGCPQEAHTLVVKLYGLLGVGDTDQLLLEVQDLIQRRRMSVSEPSPQESGHHLEAVMFNIQQLATAGRADQGSNCDGWTQVNGSALLGEAVQDAPGGLEEAVDTCERLGVRCAGVRSSGLPGRYQAVFKRGSRVLPSQSTECWILWCSDASAGRMRRSLRRGCVSQSEERVYKVMEWIPAVSTLYNLGTAVYYASVNCSETARERAVLTAVDLGTDVLMVATGGTAGVAGYALGAGVKTGVKAGVKYLLNSLKREDDVLVNQSSWRDGIFTVQ
ncbi:uncharacterized protein apof [Dunckerocampus dactyliophorus]|uniref:uncharacterized protein apof n=1 Tax=Dunckerocampus dactyliophorus TaxID=161453 RepID=UPI002404DFCE|nr:uncharacterized protein apof [Dunckerocampus dactyliophorus]